MLNPDEFYENTYVKEYEEASRSIRAAIKANQIKVSIKQYDCPTLDKYIKLIQKDLNKENPKSSRLFILNANSSFGFWEVSISTVARPFELKINSLGNSDFWKKSNQINIDFKQIASGGTYPDNHRIM